MAWHGKSLGDMLRALYAEFGEYHYGRVDLDVTPAQKQKAIAYFSSEKTTKLLDWPITCRENMDGVKIYLADIGWLLVRASGTENLLRVYCETSKQETTQRALDGVAKLVRAL